jgi:hypothetical protein
LEEDTKVEEPVRVLRVYCGEVAEGSDVAFLDDFADRLESLFETFGFRSGVKVVGWEATQDDAAGDQIDENQTLLFQTEFLRGRTLIVSLL